VEILKKDGIWEEVSCLNICEIKNNKVAEEVCAFYKKNEHLPTPTSSQILYKWIVYLRHKIKKGSYPYESTVKMFKKAGILEKVVGKD
ncbi:MAG: hypothetical protein WCJ72_17135, partial [Chryseobacterium sp.]